MRGARAVGGFAVVLTSLLALSACGEVPNELRTADASGLPLVERPQSPEPIAATPDGGRVTATLSPAPTATPSATAEPSSTPDTSTPTTTAPPDPPPEPPSEQELLEAEVVELTNDERASAGCPEVHVDDRLAAAARGHSEDMVERDFFDHVNPDGDDPWDRAQAAGYDWLASENIAWGYRTAEEVVAGWMNSDGHRRNILNCDVVAVGVGVAESSRGPSWTQMFGRR